MFLLQIKLVVLKYLIFFSQQEMKPVQPVMKLNHVISAETKQANFQKIITLLKNKSK